MYIEVDIQKKYGDTVLKINDLFGLMENYIEACCSICNFDFFRDCITNLEFQII